MTFLETLRRDWLSNIRGDVLAGVNAVDRAVLKFRREGVEVELVGMNDASTTIMDKLAVYNDPRALEKAFGH